MNAVVADGEGELVAGPRLGVFDDIPNEEYHRGPGISKSGLDLISTSPAHYIANKYHPKPPTPAMFIGSAFHCLVLEPEKFDSEYCLEPAGINKRTKEGKAAYEAFVKENEGKVILSNTPGDDPFWKPGDWDLVHRMAAAVHEHPTASILLNPEDGKAERTVFWVDKETRKLCKCRPDFHNEAHNVIVDLKSTTDASYNGFGRSCADFRYHVQDAFYLDGLLTADIFPAAFVFVAVEKQPPYGVGIYTLDAEARRVGRLEYRRNLELYARCHNENVWPAYETGVRDLQLSPWQMAAKVR